MSVTNCYFGNAKNDGVNSRLWIVGSFMGKYVEKADDPRVAKDVEVKWGIHLKGEGKDVWTKQRKSTTMSVLIRGKFRIKTPDKEVILSQEGDYFVFGPEIPHTWMAEQDTVILTVRWPSLENDAEIANV